MRLGQLRAREMLHQSFAPPSPLLIKPHVKALFIEELLPEKFQGFIDGSVVLPPSFF